jgi:tetratricopeptide (TPR) repeat protein
MFRMHAVLVVGSMLAVATQAGAQTNRWVGPKCDLKPGHFLVNSGALYLKSAAETRFEEQKQKDLRDANRVLTQALTTGSQEKNPAAWYYLGRYYIMQQDMVGADSAFTRAEALKPECKDDIGTWRQAMWVPMFNAGIAAWQANNTDSAIKAFRAATAINQSDPRGFKYLGSLLYQAGQQDSAIYYFRRTAEIAAKDPKYAQDRRDALYNLARLQHAQGKLPDAEVTYREYLALYPNDAEILASLGSVYMQTGKRDSAFKIYRQIISRGDSVGAVPLLRAGVEIFQSVPSQPDTAAAATSCRAEARTNRLTPARIRARCDSVTAGLLREHAAIATDAYRLSAQAFEAGVRLNPNYRDGLFNLVNTYLVLNDSAAMLPAAQRLVSLDPMNRQSIRILAFAHQRMGHVDSTLHYLRIADSTLTHDVTITQFDVDSVTGTLKIAVANLRSAPSAPLKLVFEFLNLQGDVVATQTVEVPSLPAGQTHTAEVKGVGPGIASWRYRKA